MKLLAKLSPSCSNMQFMDSILEDIGQKIIPTLLITT